MGGNAFTKAIADTFKLNFEKAEKLKRTAAMSKYARQIFQAMRPVFTDLASEIQRSLGFYTNANSGTKIGRVIVLGGGTKMRGLIKYLQQSLQVPVERPDSFKRLRINPEVSAAKFHENVSDLGIVYGLGVQALGAGKITSNLLPKNISRSMEWASKSKYFVLASVVFLIVSALALGRTIIDKANYDKKQRQRQKISSIIQTANDAEMRLTEQKNRGPESEAVIEKQFAPFKDRDMLANVYQLVLSVLPNEKNTPQQGELYEAFSNNDLERVLGVPRKQRRQIFVTNMSVFYTGSLDYARFVRADFKDRDQDIRDSGGGSALSEEVLQSLREEYGEEYLEYTGGGGSSEKKDGFVVTVVGYSPYGEIGELMDPAGVGNDKGKWGVITRLRNLDELVADGNCAFELYKREDNKHFNIEINEVEMSRQIPSGTGKTVFRTVDQSNRTTREEEVLIDPMTKEIINKTPVLDENGRIKVDRAGKVRYQINDHWFILNFKLKLKDTSAKEEPSV